MYYFSDTELVQMMDEWVKADSYTNHWWWFRDVILQAQEKELIKIIGHTESNPFWWRKFSESIEILDKMKIMIEKNKQRENK